MSLSREEGNDLRERAKMQLVIERAQERNYFTLPASTFFSLTASAMAVKIDDLEQEVERLRARLSTEAL